MCLRESRCIPKNRDQFRHPGQCIIHPHTHRRNDKLHPRRTQPDPGLCVPCIPKRLPAPPLVDEYVEIFWWCMKQLWPRLERKPRKFRMLLSHDVDVPFAEAFSSPKRILRSLSRDIVNRERIFQAWQLQRLVGEDHWFRFMCLDLPT